MVPLRTVLFLLIPWGACFGHDFWIEPSTFHPCAGELVGIGLRFGVGFAGEPFPRTFSHIARFTMTCAGKSQEVMGLEGGNPAGLIQAETPGLYILAYESHPLRVDLPPDVLALYLRQEGLLGGLPSGGTVSAAHHPGYEWFTRCAKSVIRLGTSTQKGEAGRSLGLRFEIIPLQDPTLLCLGDSLQVRLLFEDQPVSGILVSALNVGNLDSPQAIRTNTTGKTEFTLNHPGFWLIKAVHLFPGEGEESWRSYWASLTFDIGL